MDKKAKNKSSNIAAAGKASSSKPRDPSTHPWRYKGSVKGGLFKNVKSLPFDKKVDVPHGVCFNCWDYGHSRQNCSEPDRKDHCHNCGRIGVKITSCPRCSEAYMNYWKGKNNESSKLKSIKLELAQTRTIQRWDKKDDKVSCLHFSDVEPIPFDPELDIPYKACCSCWKPRHIGLCDLRKHDHCFNCGRIGVHMGICPRCSKAYPRYCEKKLKDGIDKVLPVVEEKSTKPKEPEVTKVPPKPSAFKTIPSGSISVRSWSSVLKDKDEGYGSQSGSVSNGSILNGSVSNGIIFNESVSSESVAIKIDNSSFKFTNDYVKDFQTLLESIRHLSIDNQNTIVLQFIADRRIYIEQVKYQKKTI